MELEKIENEIKKFKENEDYTVSDDGQQLLTLSNQKQPKKICE